MLSHLDLDVLRLALIDAEGDRVFPYLDTEQNITIGIGHNLSGVGISTDVRDLLFEEDVRDAEDSLDRALPWWTTLNPTRQRALVELCFNMGIGSEREKHGLLSFTVTLEHLRAGRYDQAADGFAHSQWARQVKARRAQRLAYMIRYGADA